MRASLKVSWRAGRLLGSKVREALAACERLQLLAAGQLQLPGRAGQLAHVLCIVVLPLPLTSSLNVLAPMRLTRLLAPAMVDKGEGA